MLPHTWRGAVYDSETPLAELMEGWKMIEDTEPAPVEEEGPDLPTPEPSDDQADETPQTDAVPDAVEDDNGEA